MTKWVEVEVTMYRRFLVEVPDNVHSPCEWAEEEVFNCALQSVDVESISEVESCVHSNQDDIARLKRFAEVIKLS